MSRTADPIAGDTTGSAHARAQRLVAERPGPDAVTTSRLVHELNGHLQSLTGYGYLLAQRLEGEDADMAGEILRATQRVAAIVARLQGTRSTPPRRAP